MTDIKNEKNGKNNKKSILIYSAIIIAILIVTLLFLPKVSPDLKHLIAIITGVITICTTGAALMLVPLLIKKISSLLLKVIIAGCIYILIMYSLWLTIDYGSIHPETSAICFNIGQSCMAAALFYLILDKVDLIRKIKSLFFSIKDLIRNTLWKPR